MNFSGDLDKCRICLEANYPFRELYNGDYFQIPMNPKNFDLLKVLRDELEISVNFK